jgi:RNA polymerase sigma factor (sigma-70 family)
MIDPQDFTAIYHATFKATSLFVHFRVTNVADGEELLQEIYLDLYRHLTKHERPDNVQAYLIVIAKHHLASYYANQARQPITLADDESTVIDQIPDELDLETMVLNTTSTEAIWAYIETFSELDRKLLIARYRFDMPYSAIAKETGLPETTIKSRVANAVRSIQEKFK